MFKYLQRLHLQSRPFRVGLGHRRGHDRAASAHGGHLELRQERQHGDRVVRTVAGRNLQVQGVGALRGHAKNAVAVLRHRAEVDRVPHAHDAREPRGERFGELHPRQVRGAHAADLLPRPAHAHVRAARPQDGGAAQRTHVEQQLAPEVRPREGRRADHGGAALRDAGENRVAPPRQTQAQLLLGLVVGTTPPAPPLVLVRALQRELQGRADGPEAAQVPVQVQGLSRRVHDRGREGHRVREVEVANDQAAGDAPRLRVGPRRAEPPGHRGLELLGPFQRRDGQGLAAGHERVHRGERGK
mmetsp:Transcript_81520/g.216032  ORF Transcript_81520/g.216032 Transcript_81520/m.216032 type:complete len:300 (-) Transcript_81520:327-1226(-)